MTIRLLTPNQAQAESRGQRALNASRDKEVSDNLVRKNREMAELEGAFQEMLASQQTRWAKEEMDHEADVVMRESEIRSLEERRRKALIPVDELKQEYENGIQRNKESLTELHNRLQECDRTQEIMETRSDELTSEKERVSWIADEIHSRLEGVRKQEEYSASNSRKVSEDIENLRIEKIRFQAYCIRKDREISEREEILEQRIISLDLEVREADFANREAALKDGWETLLRTQKELNL